MLAVSIYSGWEECVEEINKSFLDFPFRHLADSFVLAHLGPMKANTLEEKKLDRIWKHIKSDGKNFAQFSTYTMSQCSMMGVISDAVRAFIAEHGEDVFLKENLTQKQLRFVAEKLILYRDKPVSIYPIKTFLVNRGLHKGYDGPQPNTTPCKRATYFLIGEEFNEDTKSHTDFCAKTAVEAKTNATNVNTLLYLIGEELK